MDIKDQTKKAQRQQKERGRQKEQTWMCIFIGKIYYGIWCFCIQSPDDDCSFVNLQQDNEELVKRLADVQQQKWILEEKAGFVLVSHNRT